MYKSLLLCCFISSSLLLHAQKSKNNVDRPKLVVGIVIDQMRWDYLYRYYDRYTSDGGFKRFLQQGFTCENTLIPYTPTVTACGHTCVYTGSVPAIHGITGNNWWDSQLKKGMYCAEDNSVNTVGSNTDAGKMSPNNMLVTTVCDELKMATNFRSKVIGIAIKDRGAILPAGHAADAAYWYDSRTGNWITSTYYMQELPQWVKTYNESRPADKYYAQNWNTLYPKETYVQSTPDSQPYANKPFGSSRTGFPYDFSEFITRNNGAISTTPWGNAMTVDMAKAAVTNEQLGADDITDMLAVSFSSPDYIGHSFGPNSIAQEDDFLRLDQQLGDFFKFLDKQVGKNNYLVFLSADHAVAHVPGFMEEHKLPGRVLNDDPWKKELAQQMQEKYGTSKLIITSTNSQIHLNHQLIDSLKLDITAIKKWLIGFISRQEGVARVFELDEVTNIPLPSKIRDMVVNGYYPSRCGDLQIILQPGWLDGGHTGTGHSTWYPYDAHIPLLFYGWNVAKGKTNRETYMTDIAPTIAAMLHIQMPSGNVGTVIEEVMK